MLVEFAFRRGWFGRWKTPDLRYVLACKEELIVKTVEAGAVGATPEQLAGFKAAVERKQTAMDAAAVSNQ